MSVNKVILVGHLGRDPETRDLNGGQTVCKFSIATHHNHKDKDGQREQATEWHQCVVFGKQAETAKKYLKKGMLLYLEGRIQSREYTDRQKQKRTAVEIIAGHFRMLGGKPGDAREPDEAQPDSVASDVDDSWEP